MASTSQHEIMEIDSDDESPPKKTKNGEQNEKIDDKKALEIILIDEDSDEEKEDKDYKKKEENSGKDIVEVKDIEEQEVKKAESNAEKGEPIQQPGIIDIKDDDEEEEDAKIIKQVYTPKNAESTEQREGLIIKDVKEITKNRTADEGGTGERNVVNVGEGENDEERDNGGGRGEEEEDDIRVEEVVNPEVQANRRKCLNSGCKSGVDLRICKESSVFTFYGMKPRAKQLICKACSEAAEGHFEKLVTLLKENKPLFSAHYPPRSEVVLLEDSDEDNEDELVGEELELDAEVSRIVENNDLLESLIKQTMEKCGFNEQMKENKRLLEIDADEVDVKIKELDKRFSTVFSKLEDLQYSVYKEFEPQTKSLSPIEIIDVIEEPMLPHHSTVKQGGLSSAVMQKPQGGTSGRLVAIKKVTQYAGNPANRQSFSPSKVSTEQDIVALDSIPATLPPLPPFGALQRPKLSKGDSVYVMRQSLFTAWGLAEVLEIMPKTADNPDCTQLRIVYDLHKRVPPTKYTSAKLVAYYAPSPVRLPVGSRVIAVYRGDEDVTAPPGNHYFYSGIIAESPKINNKFRYLVFFDDGYTQYVYHENIRLVCESSRNVWEDVHPESKTFIKDYLTRYPERPMVKLNIDEIVKTEWNGKWWVARVQDIDASLVKMYFDADERTEWIYRGSTRLGPLYIEMVAARDRQAGKSRHASILKRQNPYVEYTQNLDESNSDDDDDDVELVKPDEQAAQPARSVARKSTNRVQKQNNKPETVYHKVGPIDITVKPKQFVQQNHPGTIVKVSLFDAPKPRQFMAHTCTNRCVAWTKYTFEMSKEIPCLLRPLKFGFQRLFYTRKSKPFVVYMAPCGRRLRNHDEIVHYLYRTQSELACDYFDFDPWVSCVNEYKLPKNKVNASIKDLSYGKENVSIECVNYVDCTYPDFVYYQTERRAMENVNLNTAPDFLSGCDCVDNCQDRSKCSCWQLTITGAKCIPGLDFDESTLGYQYRRLPERVVSGIYECNSQCKCSSTCMNRVVQFPISVKLQLYKTLMKGWGIRCLHDIPQGSFICIYAGNLLTEQAANEGGKTYGDEYLAELDFIEVIENLKDDYESDVPESSEDEEDTSNKNRGKRTNRDENDYDEEDVDDPEPMDEEEEADDVRRRGGGGGYEMDRTFSVSRDRVNTDASSSNMRDRLRARESGKNKAKGAADSDDSDSKNEKSRQPTQFNASIKAIENEQKPSKSVREYYGDDECIYIMDAKNGGNIGRYMNHSCNPNVFVQNVFVDTHDLRFPWVAFFASRFIEAGQELTWDYNYDVGSVPGKALHCYCGEANCRRRLL